MPGMDGFEVARRLRDLPGANRVPLLFLTAFSRENRRLIQAYELGAVDFLLKPLDPRIVQRKVEVFVDLHRQAGAAVQESSRPNKLWHLLSSTVGPSVQWGALIVTDCNGEVDFGDLESLSRLQLPIVATDLDAYEAAIQLKSLVAKIDSQNPVKVARAIELYASNVDLEMLLSGAKISLLGDRERARRHCATGSDEFGSAEIVADRERDVANPSVQLSVPKTSVSGQSQ